MRYKTIPLAIVTFSALVLALLLTINSFASMSLNPLEYYKALLINIGFKMGLIEKDKFI